MPRDKNFPPISKEHAACIFTSLGIELIGVVAQEDGSDIDFLRMSKLLATAQNAAAALEVGADLDTLEEVLLDTIKVLVEFDKKAASWQKQHEKNGDA